MPVEIERKFLLKHSGWQKLAKEGQLIKQGYLNSHQERTVRVRTFGNRGFLTIKGKSQNLSRAEFEYEIPMAEALEMLELCEKPLIEKTRYLVRQSDCVWEVDIFDGKNKGLQVAEVELPRADYQVHIPDWIGQEVSNDVRYYNSSLIAKPYCEW